MSICTVICMNEFLSFQLNCVGETVETDRRRLHLLSTQHNFAPVAVGTFHPPKQVGLIVPGAFTQSQPVHSVLYNRTHLSHIPEGV